MLVTPFIKVYTHSINDVNYIYPLFAYVITIAHGFHCLRLPYHIMIKAFGKYKETQMNYVIAAVINIVVSVVTVIFWGLIGVAIGTLIAMGYQTVWMAWYNSKHLIKISMKSFFKQMIVDILTVAIAGTICSFLMLLHISYLWWIVLAIEVAVVWLMVIVLLNIIFYRDKMKWLFSGIKKKKRKKA